MLTNYITIDFGIIILECIEPIVKHRSQANAFSEFNELGMQTF